MRKETILCDGCGMEMKARTAVEGLCVAYYYGHGPDQERDRRIFNKDFCSVQCALEAIEKYMKEDIS
jgi:hypothetical protein